MPDITTSDLDRLLDGFTPEERVRILATASTPTRRDSKPRCRAPSCRRRAVPRWDWCRAHTPDDGWIPSIRHRSTTRTLRGAP